MTACCERQVVPDTRPAVVRPRYNPAFVTRTNRLLLGLLVAIVSIVGGVLFLFGIDRATNGAEILGNVTVNGVELGGLGEFEAIERVRAMEQDLIDTPIPVVVAGRTFSLDPVSIGLDIDEHVIVEAALHNGRSGSVPDQFRWWLDHFGSDNTELDLPYTFDRDALQAMMADWQQNGIADPAYPGDIAMAEGAIVYSYPRSGTGIEVGRAIELVDVGLTDRSRAAVELPTRQIEAVLGTADIDAVVGRIDSILAGPITLRAPQLDREVSIPQSVLAEALVVQRLDNTLDGIPQFHVRFDRNPVLEYVEAFAPYLETDPVDAELVIDEVEDTVTIIPSIPVQEPDPVGLANAAWTAARSESRTADIPYRAGREADLSTEDIEAFGIKERISEFTTNHSCCQNRVTNIQQIADDVDGAWVMPGEVFSLNAHVGKRIRANGYVCAGALLHGQIVDEGEICIGGGTSQFTTTMYNAIFFAGVEDVYHFKHTAWFSRYPEGREATLGFPSPDLIFRNNTDSVIVIMTSHTDTSVTVEFYGDNGGIEVEAGLSGRYNHTQPFDGGCVADEAPSGTVIQNGTSGWTVTVYRYITFPDGTKTTESWVERYQGLWKLKSC